MKLILKRNEEQKKKLFGKPQPVYVIKARIELEDWEKELMEKDTKKYKNYKIGKDRNDSGEEYGLPLAWFIREKGFESGKRRDKLAAEVLANTIQEGAKLLKKELELEKTDFNTEDVIDV